MFITFFLKSLAWMAVGGIFFPLMIGLIAVVPGFLAGFIKHPTIQKPFIYLFAIAMFYGLSAICGLFALRSIWYTSQDGIEHPWMYHLISVILAYGEIAYMGHKGTQSQGDFNNVGKVSFLAIPITTIFVFFEDLPRVLYPFLSYWY